MRKFFRNKKLFVLFAFLCGAFLLSFGGSAVYATSYTDVASFKIRKDWWSDAATITKKYYVFVEKQMDGKKAGRSSAEALSYLYRCSRSNPTQSSCKKSSSSYKWGHVLTILHKWNTNYVLVRSDYDKDVACWDIESFKKISMSHCSSWAPPKGPRLRMETYSVKQGYAKFDKYYVRVFGKDDSNLHLVLYDSTKRGKGKHYKALHDIKFSNPKKLHELEGVMVDGDTATVYFTSVTTSPRKVHFNRLSDATIDKYLKPLAGKTGDDDSGSGGSAGGGSQRSGGGSGSAGGNSDTKDSGANSGVQIEPSRDVMCATILKAFCEKAESDGEATVKDIIIFFISIMTVGIGVLGTIGLIVCGYLIMTARDNEQQIEKAKKRMVEIVIGIVIWVIGAGVVLLFVPDQEAAEYVNGGSTIMVKKLQ